jgi:DNA-binding NarL/FixJ family response regulator
MLNVGGEDDLVREPAAVPRSRNRVVVVDDQPDMRDLVSLIIDDEDDFDVVGTAGDGAEAVRVVGELHPDLVVLDVAMPVMSGIEALKCLRVGSPDTRIVILTAHPRDSVDAVAHRLADDYLDKTIVATDLVARLRAVCERPARGIATSD